jgi:hypothetical protein
MTYETVDEYELKIAELRQQAKDVQGTKCEVYQRIVGYRNIEGWNPGKKAEFANRLNFRFSQEQLGEIDK